MVATAALVLGLFAGALAGGSVRGLAHFRLRNELWIVLGFVVQGIARGRLVGTTPTSWSLGTWLVTSLALIALLAANVGVPGIAVAAAGLLMNLDVVVLNGAMPVVVNVTGVSGRLVATGSAGFYKLASPGIVLAWMGDVIPLDVLGQRFFLSSGDVIMAIGVIAAIASAMQDAASDAV